MSSPRLLSLQAFTVQLEVEVKRAQRYGRALSVALIALDGLRGLGGQAASGAHEAVLGAVGRAIAGGVRGSDLACPTGGGEFAVLFAETGAEQAARATRRVIASLDDVDVAGVGRLAPAAAIAELAPHEDPDALLDRARGALTSARSVSGDQVAVAAPVGPGWPTGRLGVERS